jgi:hypothetical protein
VDHDHSNDHIEESPMTKLSNKILSKSFKVCPTLNTQDSIYKLKKLSKTINLNFYKEFINKSYSPKLENLKKEIEKIKNSIQIISKNKILQVQETLSSVPALKNKIKKYMKEGLKKLFDYKKLNSEIMKDYEHLQRLDSFKIDFKKNIEEQFFIEDMKHSTNGPSKVKIIINNSSGL